MKKIFQIYILLILSLLLFIIIAYQSFAFFDNAIYDSFIPPIKPHPSIVVIEIDDPSLEKLGQWPWSRGLYADLIQKIAPQRPAVVAFDILLAEEKMDEDVRLTEQIELNKKKTTFVFASKLASGNEVIQPIDAILDHAESGYANIATEKSGKVRRYQLKSNSNKSLALKALEAYFFKKNLGLKNKQSYIHFTDNYKNFQSIGFSEVLDNPEKIDLRDKIVLVGATPQDVKHALNDNFIAANNGKYIPGIYLHANMINTVLRDSYIWDLSLLTKFIISESLFLIVFLITLYLISWQKIIGLIPLPIYLVGSIVLYQFGYRINVIPTLIITFVLWAVLFVIEYYKNYKETAKVKKAFSQYVNPQLLKEIIKRKADFLKLGGEERFMTVLFSDIMGFTSLSETLTPTQLITLLNKYLTEVTDVILKNDGVIDKYVGDEIMALWGAPLKDRKMASKACRAGIEMQKALAEFNKKIQNSSNKNSPFKNVEIKVGLGIHFGNMIVGNLGSKQKFDYTVIGDNVNLGARIESITRKYGVRFLVSEEFLKRIKKEKSQKEFSYRIIDRVKVKGKDNPVVLYEMVGFSQGITADQKELVKKYEKAFKLYQNQEYGKAITIFAGLAQKEDPPSLLMTNRIQLIESLKERYRNFDGVWKWEEK